MPIINKVKGDLVKLAKQGEFDMIIHGCNTHATMGAGIAPQINNAFSGLPLKVDEEYHIPVDSEERLGHYSECYAMSDDEKVEFSVINMYTQHYFRTKPDGSPAVDYKAISEGFTRLNADQVKLGLTKPHIKFKIGIPLIGAGLAGGHWEAIEEIINLTTPDLEITLVEYDG